jgi:hypothetical protein
MSLVRIFQVIAIAGVVVSVSDETGRRGWYSHVRICLYKLLRVCERTPPLVMRMMFL